MPLVVTIRCKPEPMTSQILISWSGIDEAPQVATFGAEGGEVKTEVTPSDSGTAKIRYFAKVNFDKADWPVLEISGEYVVTATQNCIELQPSAWLSRQTIHLLIPKGVETAHDHLNVNLSYRWSNSEQRLTESARITPSTPGTIVCLHDPRFRTNQASLFATGIIGGRFIRSGEIQLNPTQDAIYLLADEGGVHLTDGERS